MKNNKHKIYLNKAQHYIGAIAPRDLTVIASRRFGKSEGVIAPVLLRNAQAMPRSSGAIVGATYKQVLTRTLPATIHALKRFGYHEGTHFYVGRKAPKSANFAEPHIKPHSWDYYIHWYNGAVNPLISQDIPYSSNSLTLDYVIGDEAKTLNYTKLTNETIPANSGLHYFKDCPWHTGTTWVTDMPTNKLGSWILNEETKMDKDLLKFVETLIFQLWKVKQESTGSRYYFNKIRLLEIELNKYRAELSLFVIYNILDNIEIVGEKYVKKMHRDLSPFLFQTAILSQKMRYTEGGFYSAIKPELHYYNAFDNDYLNRFRNKYNEIDYKSAQEQSFNCLQDTDINVDEPLCIAFDTNININWLVVGQADYQKGELKTLKSFYVKNPRMLTELCNEFADYYDALPNKNIVFFYDHTFLQGKSAISIEAFHQTIERILTGRGFFVESTYIGQAPRHDRKFNEIDNALKGSKGLMPKFNEPNNQILLEAMEKTGTKVTSRGWGKDKSGEKNPDTPDDPVELRTDGTDAWDTLFIGCNNHRRDQVYSYGNYYSG